MTQVAEKVFEFEADAHEVSILDIRGRAIWTGIQQEPGTPIRWDGTDGKGRPLMTGGYVLRTVSRNRNVAYKSFFLTCGA